MINADTRHRAQASIGNRILRMRDLRERLGLSASHLYALIAAGRFPKPFC
jgi:predicted DNA-binding transcriptional regulator AlpA